MAITLADFNKIWASTSPLTPYSFSESNYKQGWNFVGSTPPARQMWDFLQKNNDEKMQYLANNYLPLSGGTMTGMIIATGNFIKSSGPDGDIRIFGGTTDTNGANLWLLGNDSSGGGRFDLYVYDGTNYKSLRGTPNGSLSWDGKEVERVNATSTKVDDSGYIRYENGLQICWGVVNLPETGDTVNTSFPVAFSKTPTVTGSLVRTVTWRIWGTSTTDFYAQQAAAPNTNKLQWVAVGWWK